jgi:lipoate-protein ligase A
MRTSTLMPPAPAHNAGGEGAAVPDVGDRAPGTTARLRELAESGNPGALEWTHAGPSAAFSRRDAILPGFPRAVASAQSRGYEAFVRPVGGRLAMYGEGSLVLDVLTRSEDPRPGTTTRFRLVSEAIASGLRRLGVDARVGEVPGEYCPGEWSVNAQGRVKLVGTGQRLTRDALLVTAVIVVGHHEPLAEAMTEAYAHLGHALDPRTVGSVATFVPGVTLSDVTDAVGEALAETMPLDRPDLVAGRRLLEPWDPR